MVRSNWSRRLRRPRISLPLRLVSAVGVSVFLLEMGLMTLPVINEYGPGASLLDAGLLTIFISPILYVTVFRPLSVEISERKSAQEKLLAAQSHLESKVKDRTTDLRKSIDALHEEVRERTRAQGALEDSERRYRILVQTSPDAIALLAKDLTITLCNQKLVELAGRSQDQILGASILDLVEGESSKFEQLKEGRESVTNVALSMICNTKPIPVELSAAAIPSQSDQEATIAVFRDVRERHRLEEQLRHSQKLEAVGRLAGGVAHDFNNLLTVVSGYTDLILERADVPDDVREEIAEIRVAADRATSLTRQLLAFSRRQPMQPKVLDLNHVVGGMNRLLRRLVGEDISLLIRADESLWKVEADPSQMEQVILNLAVNARDAMPRGGELTIETANVESPADTGDAPLAPSAGPYVMLAVTDNGEGMDAETMDHIFEPFFTTKEAGRGTGLGLATLYGIVQQYNGSIWVHSEPGQGTSFKIYLPRRREEQEPDFGSAPSAFRPLLLTPAV